MFTNSIFGFGNPQNVECGLICILPRPPGDFFGPERTAPIPLQSVNIVASVVHAVAHVESTQILVNKEEQPIEAIYYFPVDSNGRVTHFHAELEGRTIKGIVKPQDEAKQQYEKAVAEKQTAFLLNSNTNTPYIFKVKIGFLKPGSQVKIVIGYVTEVKKPSGVVISAPSPDGPLSIEVKMDTKNDLGSIGVILKLAAIKMIRELEIQSAAPGYVEGLVARSTEAFLKKEITELSVKHGVGSRYTSFVAVDTERDTTAKDNWVIQTRYVPSQFSHGWHGGFGGAVTPNMQRSSLFSMPQSTSCGFSFGGAVPQSMQMESPISMPQSTIVPFGSPSSGSLFSSLAKTGTISKRLCPMQQQMEIADDDTGDCSPLKSKDPLNLIVSTQSFDGSFALNENFAAAVGTTLATLENEAKAKDWENGSFATAVAIAYFVQKLADAAESWKLVVEKAKEWLVKHFPQTHAEILAGGATFVDGLK